MSVCPHSEAYISGVSSFCWDQYDDKNKYFMTTQKEKKKRILTLFCIFGSAPWTRRSSAVAVCPFLLALIRAVSFGAYIQHQYLFPSDVSSTIISSCHLLLLWINVNQCSVLEKSPQCRCIALVRSIKESFLVTHCSLYMLVYIMKMDRNTFLLLTILPNNIWRTLRRTFFTKKKDSGKIVGTFATDGLTAE